jgi:hypothetical protein
MQTKFATVLFQPTCFGLVCSPKTIVLSPVWLRISITIVDVPTDGFAHAESPKRLVGAISRNYAAALQERLAKGSAFLKRLRLDADSKQTLVDKEVDPTAHEPLETCLTMRWRSLWPDFVVGIDRVLEVLGREAREPGLRRHPAGDRFGKSECA